MQNIRNHEQAKDQTADMDLDVTCMQNEVSAPNQLQEIYGDCDDCDELGEVTKGLSPRKIQRNPLLPTPEGGGERYPAKSPLPKKEERVHFCTTKMPFRFPIPLPIDIMIVEHTLTSAPSGNTHIASPDLSKSAPSGNLSLASTPPLESPDTPPKLQ